ncbi:putative tail fiber protein [uncultured Mediterranean phage uvMED]|nr:putative tail fiber protein [uncultured Mediterranean phage uvMED]
MATFDINDTTRRVQYTTNGSQTQFAFSFQINADSELKVILGETTLTLSANYTVTIATNGTGTVDFSSAPSTGQKLTILANKPLSRESVYSTGASFTAAALETDFDNTIMVLQQFEEKIDRTLQLPEFVTGSTPPSLIVPYNDTASDNSNKVIGYNTAGTALTLLSKGVTSVSVTTNTLSPGSSATGAASITGDALSLTLGIPTGATGSGIATLADDTSPQLGANLDLVTFDIVTTSNRDLELAPNGTGHVTVKGNTNSGAIQFNCESNSHGQIVKAQPHSAGVTNELTLPAGGNQELVGATATQTLTNKTINVSQLTGTYTTAQVSKTETATISSSKTLDFDANQNFILTLGSGANTLTNPTTEAGNVGQTGVMIFIQPSSGSAGTVSLGTDYETPAAGGLTLSSTNSAYDVVPYIIKADNSILLGSPQLAFG